MSNTTRDYNIDILVKGVKVLLIPSFLNGLEILIGDTCSDAKYLVEDFGFKIDKNLRIFQLKNAEGKVFFLNAMALGVFHNQLDILETSIGRYDREMLGENILWFPD